MSEKCLQCGKYLTHVPGRRKKEFCNNTCRSNHWNKVKKAAVKNAIKGNIPLPPDYIEIKKIGVIKKSGIIEPIVISKQMPKGLTLQQQIQWKIDNP